MQAGQAFARGLWRWLPRDRGNIASTEGCAYVRLARPTIYDHLSVLVVLAESMMFWLTGAADLIRLASRRQRLPSEAGRSIAHLGSARHTHTHLLYPKRRVRVYVSM